MHMLIRIMYPPPLHKNTGNSLPIAIYHADTVQYGDTFLMVGGEVDKDTIYEYDRGTSNWILHAERLDTERVHHTVSVVDRSIFPDCSNKTDTVINHV